jgi:hypothetical protein
LQNQKQSLLKQTAGDNHGGNDDKQIGKIGQDRHPKLELDSYSNSSN